MSGKRRNWLAALIAALTFLAFLPALRNGFVNWDDNYNFLKNFHYRGLDWTQIAWMFSTFLGGHYQPLSWLTLGFDYALWGMNPLGYHLTNLMLHAANAAVFFFVARRLLALADPEHAESHRSSLDFSAAFAALFFSLHPLRVESVAWVTERRDVLSGLFYLLTVLCYLKASACRDKMNGRRWLLGAIALFALSLLSKVSGITLPLVLVVLDIYPLRRLPGGPKRWLSPEFRHVWLEKVPFLVLAVPAAGAAILAETQAGSIRSVAEVGLAGRAALSAFSAVFYLWKILVPTGLLPLYERLSPFNPFLPSFVLCGLIVVALGAVLFAGRRRCPAALASLAAYLATLAPVMGFFTNGAQLAADRYSYLSCLAWAVLAGGGLRALRRHATVLQAVASCVLVVLAVLTWRQTLVWHDSETLWRHVLAARPDTASARNYLGMALQSRGALAEALPQFQEALRLAADYAEAHNNLGTCLQALDRPAQAAAHYREALRLKPDFAEAHNNLGVALHDAGQTAQAMAHHEEALRLRPDYPEAHNNLGMELALLGRNEEASGHFIAAIKADPEDQRARLNLGAVLWERGRQEEAVEHFVAALKLKGGQSTADTDLTARAHNNLGSYLWTHGRRQEAVAHYQEALRLNPRLAEVQNNLGVALLDAGRFEEAAARFREALRLSPGFAAAKSNLALAASARERALNLKGP